MIIRRALLAIALPAMLIMAVLGGVSTADAADWRSQSVHISDHGLKMPDIIDGPVIDLTIRNDGTIAHEMAVARVKPGTTLRQVIGRLGTGGAEPPFVLNDPGGVFLLGRGEQVRYQRLLQPGTYVYFVPRADGSVQLSPAAYHLSRIVDDRRRELPQAHRNINLGDDGITLPRLSAGAHSYAITNVGTQPHEVFIVGVAHPDDLDHADELGAWLDGGQIGPPPIPVHFPGSHQTIDAGVTVLLTLTLHPATIYAFVDFQTGNMATAMT